MAQPQYMYTTFPDKPKTLIIGAELNRGAWGAVYNGELQTRPVAVKRIHELLHQGGGEEERRKLFADFREECKKLQSLSHPHVVGFIGAFNDPRLGPILVMEKMQENLRQFLDRCKKNLRLPKQLRISLEIIRGVSFLHHQTPPLVHRDLNDKNVMFSFEGVIKIGDFGQSKLKKDLYLTSGQPGMVTFMPPEALDADTSKYNESLDIFSVGVLMLEIGTQQEPLVNLCGIGVIREVERREKDLKALGEEHPLRQPVLLCLKDNPKERPKASDLQREVLSLVDGGFESPLPPSLGKEVRSIKLPDMPMRVESVGSTIHNGKVYINANDNDEFHVLVCSTNEQKWNVLEGTERHKASAISLVKDHITLIGGFENETEMPTNTLSTWYEEEGRWIQVLPPMPTGRIFSAVIYHDNLLLVTGGVTEGHSVLNTTDALDLTTMKWTSPEGLNFPVPLWGHHLALCGEYLYLVGGATVCPWQSPEDLNFQAWRVKWSNVKQTAAPQHSQPQMGIWRQIADPRTLFPTAVSFGGTLYTVGGHARDGKPISTVYSYIPAKNQWMSVGDMSVERAVHCAVPLSSNTIFVAGGTEEQSYSAELLLL